MRRFRRRTDLNERPHDSIRCQRASGASVTHACLRVSMNGTERSEEAQDVERVTSAFAAESEWRELKARSQARGRHESSTFQQEGAAIQRSGAERSKSHG